MISELLENWVESMTPSLVVDDHPPCPKRHLCLRYANDVLFTNTRRGPNRKIGLRLLSLRLRTIRAIPEPGQEHRTRFTQRWPRLDDISVDPLGLLRVPPRVIEAVRKLWWNANGQRYLWEREPRILRHYTIQLARRLKQCPPVWCLSLGSIAAAALPEGAPYVVYVDPTFLLNVDYYPTMTGICHRSRRLGHEVDKRAFGRAKGVIATSEWAATSIVNEYGVAAEHVTVVPVGAQHVCPLNEVEVLISGAVAPGRANAALVDRRRMEA